MNNISDNSTYRGEKGTCKYNGHIQRLSMHIGPNFLDGAGDMALDLFYNFTYLVLILEIAQ